MVVKLGIMALLKLGEVVLAFFIILLHCGEIWAVNHKSQYLYFFTCYSASLVPLTARLCVTLWKGYGFPAPTEYTLIVASAITTSIAAGFSSFDIEDYVGVDSDDESAPKIEDSTRCTVRMSFGVLLILGLVADLVLTTIWDTGPPAFAGEPAEPTALPKAEE